MNYYIMSLLAFVLLYAITEIVINWTARCKKCGEEYSGTFFGMIVSAYWHIWKDRNL